MLCDKKINNVVKFKDVVLPNIDINMN